MISKFSFPTEIYFGPGARWQSAEQLKSLGRSRPLLVTDRVVATLGFFDEYKRYLAQNGLKPTVFSDLSANPTRPEAVSGAEAFHACDADSIIAMGGGAPLDAAKAIAVLVHHSGDLFDYEDGVPSSRPIDKEIPYWIALPTTAGTGSEAGRSAVISDEKTHIKKIIFSPRLLAKVVYADPELTLGLPPNVTASTGMDALTHCVEAYLARGYHPICDSIALEGFRLASKNLQLAVEEPSNLEARSAMLMASIMGAIAFQKGLGLTHSCAHALSTVHGLHHGLANGVMIDHALSHNVAVSGGSFLRLLAMTSAESRIKNPEPAALLDWLVGLKRSIGIPASLLSLKLPRESIPRLSEVASLDGCHHSNPNPCDREVFQRVFAAAFE